MRARWIVDSDRVLDTLTGEAVTKLNNSTLLEYANAWEAFGNAIQSGDQRVDDVLRDAGLSDEEEE